MATRKTTKMPKAGKTAEAKVVATPVPADAAASDAQHIPEPISVSGFVTDPRSQFKDRYSIEGEEKALQPFLENGEVPEGSPMYDRWLELCDRKMALEEAQKRYLVKEKTDGLVTTMEALGIKNLGSLVDEETDQMTLHTKEGYRLFMGRGRDPEHTVAPIVGGRRVAAALRSLWILTYKDNPYADWALLRHEQGIVEAIKRIDQRNQEALEEIERMRKMGLSFSILHSTAPKTIELGYKSPYGYAISQLVVKYDYFIRLQKTLARKSLRTDEQVHGTIRRLTTFLRRVFIETTRFDRWLNQKEMIDLSRADYVEGAPVDARNRVKFASATFGMVPAEIFTGQIQPSHTKRRYRLSKEDRESLLAVGANLGQIDQQMAIEILQAMKGREEGDDAEPSDEEHGADAGLV